MRRALLFCSLLVACGSGDDDGTLDGGAARDAGIVADAGPTAPSVQIGTGQDSFVGLDDGDTVELVSGPQASGRFGGHHIWSAMRIRGIARTSIDRLTFTISSTNGESRATIVRTAAAPIQMDPTTGALQLIAVPPIVDDCCLIAEGEALMGATLTTLDGDTYEDEVRVMVSRCPGPSEPGPNLCP